MHLERETNTLPRPLIKYQVGALVLFISLCLIMLRIFDWPHRPLLLILLLVRHLIFFIPLLDLLLLTRLIHIILLPLTTVIPRASIISWHWFAIALLILLLVLANFLKWTWHEIVGDWGDLREWVLVVFGGVGFINSQA